MPPLDAATFAIRCDFCCTETVENVQHSSLCIANVARVVFCTVLGRVLFSTETVGRCIRMLEPRPNPGTVWGMLSAADTLRRMGGIARGLELQKYGFTRSVLARDVDAGRLDRLRNGVFSTSDVNADVRAAVAHGGALTCASVLRLYGVWVLPAPDGPHVWLGVGARPHQHPGCSCTTHRHRGRAPLARVDVATALIHLRHCAGEEAFFAAYESAWHQRLLTRADRERVRSALPESARWLVDFARPDADSGLESLVRLRLHLVGIAVTSQVRIAGVGVVDFVIDGWIVIEVDGRENHESTTHRHKDRVRDAAAARQGYETLRFDYAQVVHGWEHVQAAIHAVIRRGRAVS